MDVELGADTRAQPPEAPPLGGVPIVRFAGIAVDGLEDLRNLVRDRRPGDTVSVLYLRNGEAHATSATLGPRID